MFWLKLIRDFIKILREGQTPAQVAGGFALGSILGLSPNLTLQGILVWFVILILDVNLSAALVALTVFSLFAFLLDPAFHWVGYQILTNIDALTSFWTTLYNAPVAPLTRFNNTVVMGSFISALILFLPVYYGMKKFVVAYRARVGSKVEKWKIYQVIKRSTLVQWYEKLRDLGG
ncbi:MAG: TIGR03546 family protein [Ignavibacteriae bacterium]|nr:TIGR03546 family protein [Ignavibacteriota bacterium]